MAELRADSPLQYAKGVGPARAALFAAIGVNTVGDLLAYYPFRYEPLQGEVDIEAAEPDANVTIRGEVQRVRGRWPLFSAEVYDGTGSLWLRWFDERYGAQGLHVGTQVIANGKTRIYNDRLELVHPRVSVFGPDDPLPPRSAGAQLLGVYRGNEQLKSPAIRRVVQSILAAGPPPLDDPLPAALRVKYGWPTRAAAVRAMHLPNDEQELAQARSRLAYEELFLLELGLALRRRRLLATARGQRLPVTATMDQRIRARYPFPLTAAQNRVITEIVGDLNSGRPMTRLLQGDVGSGKTVVALYAALVAVANGRQAAIMAPTEILAQQHFRNIEHYLAGSRVRRLMLRGGLGREERAAALRAIAAGEVDLIVGTHALVQKDVAFKDLALVVVDEQHKFGVIQRAGFRTKGFVPHYLVMTATPIPRTLAMTVFGDLDVSVIDALPPCRGKVRTHIVAGRLWEAMMTRLRPRLEAGDQAYVVCPIIGEEETPDAAPDAVVGPASLPASQLKPAAAGAEARPTAARPPTAQSTSKRSAGGRKLASVLETHARLTDGPWRDLPVGLLHGGMSTEDRQAAIGAFAAGRLRALVATTVIEVGMDVPSATLMIVDHAERFGLAQLHQLRGRIGRGNRDGECVLVAHTRSEKSAERLRVLTETTDGFRIAEADLRQRGPGELLGTRQHGLPPLLVADLVADFGLLEKARQDAFALVAADPQLAGPEHKRLIAALRLLFKGKLALIDAA